MHGIKRLADPLVIQVATILVAALVVVTATLVTSSHTHSKTDASGVESDAATATAQLQSRVLLLSTFLAQVQPGQPLELQAALDAHDQAAGLVQDASSLANLTGDPGTLDLRLRAHLLQASLQTFFNTRTPADRDRAADSLTSFANLVQPLQEQFSTDSDRDQADLKAYTNTSRAIVTGTVLAAALVTGLLSLVVGRRLRAALNSATGERDRLADLSQKINKRNEQFNALYQVVNEVTDNLSVRYDVTTTVEEAAKLVSADHVVLRLLKEQTLEVAGHYSNQDELPDTLGPLPLGIGISGRAAKRGKTTRIQEGAAGLMAEDENIAGIEAGIVMPLIVGARVMGTLACWSTQPAAFDSDDERILELMAAQVASAVAAADLHETSEQKALHDVLTGLPNRRQLVEDSAAIKEQLANHEPLAVVMLDIDHFKHFNDDFGHRVGDVTLQKVADVMRSHVRDTDRIYRYGGEEFVAILHNVDEATAFRLTERLRQAVGKTPLTGENLEPVGPITVSAGIALAPSHSTDLDQLLRQADEALYLSKSRGRNRVTVAPSLAIDEAA